MRLQFRTPKELHRFCWGCVAWTLGGAALPLLLRLLDPAVGIVGADSCIFFGAFALCLYAAGTWISQSISQGGMDAPKLSSMHNMVGLLYVLSVLLGPVLLLRLGGSSGGSAARQTLRPGRKQTTHKKVSRPGADGFGDPGRLFTGNQ